MGYTLSNDHVEEAIRWRQHLHENPELGFDEKQTSAFISSKLFEWGYEIASGYGKTGVVGTLRKGSSNRSIGIRADMDALPIVESTSLPYASKKPGIMHACGHDGHVASALAAARALRGIEFDGTVTFIFQPAEENEGGARAMIEDGLFKDYKVDAVFGMHNWPALPLGSIVARPDQMMAAFATFEIVVRGRGAHGAMPHEGADPVVAASQIVSALQTISSRNVSPLESAVVSVTQIHGGDAWNVIPEEVVLRGTTRWFDEEIGERIQQRVKQVSASIAEGLGCHAAVDYFIRYPATINDAHQAAVVKEVAATLPGLTIVDALPSMAAEDFAFMLQEQPGCYFWLGAGRSSGENPGLHSSKYDFNDAVLPLAATMWVSLVQSELRAAS
ncbi:MULTISPECIES: M20 aminoacylase family protein [Rhizobium/Agrobacterium group]|jgi:amidohydrolase|uniref:M20 aminoacylase family protein n=1 Tax=Rhizobium/Agrobacterium group TaxID=227290 RepID=UPI000629FB59|nr:MULTISPECIES: M20 aminoacylase family protein [Rhizobium/Agrobacterium group]KKX23744.1 peptidase M20 [Rhizobium sp. LC145]KNY30830.1 peptidase M20 [Agrobacterium sp. SUL3]TKT42635.1 amidohydrolase [Rhizobiaceae bacterium LC148]